MTFIFTPHLAQSLVHLETLRIEHCRGLKHLIREKDEEKEIIPESLGFPKLKTLSIRGCDELEYVFPVSVSPSLLNLEEMEIAFGANLKQIFYSGEGDALTRDGIIHFPQLRKLSLSSCNVFGPKNFTAQLPSLQVLAIEGHEELGDFLAQLQGLTNLIEIKITNCKAAQHLIQVGSFVPNRSTGHEWWQALKNLEIKTCKSLEEVFELEEADERSSEVMELLSSLTRLELEWLPELKCIWKGPTRHVSLRSLVHLELGSLDKLTFIFTPHLAKSLVHLETIRINDCSGLKHLIREMDDEREIFLYSLGFLKLKTLSISGCDELEYVFPISISPSLLNLEEIEIVNCKSVEEVFELGEVGEGINEEEPRLLSSLTRLELKWLPELKCIWKGSTKHVSLRSLIYLKLQSLDKLMFIFTPYLAQSLVHLETLCIDDCSGLKHLIREMDDGREIILRSLGFIKLKTLSISGCDELEYVFPISMSPSLLNLKEIEIVNYKSVEEVFELGEAGEGINKDKKLLLLSSLTRLELKWLPELKCIWKGPTKHVSLRSLIHLELQSLDKLTFIFTPQLAQSLVHLETIRINDCSGLKHLIREMDDGREIIRRDRDCKLQNIGRGI
ncbi:hypothetical protein OIU78_017600 [Salix suchowensis]|nr:hypothetical protein OIU78_017600 [Salix suchowensis]